MSTDLTSLNIDQHFPAVPFYTIVQERGIVTESQLRISQVGAGAAELHYCPTIFDKKDMEVMQYLIDNMEKFDSFINFNQLLDSYQMQMEILEYNSRKHEMEQKKEAKEEGEEEERQQQNGVNGKDENDKDKKNNIMPNGQNGSSSQLARNGSVLVRNMEQTDQHNEHDYGVDERCSVCLAIIGHEDGEREDVMVRVLPCNHFFHVECIDRWLINNKKHCPYCQKRYLD